MAVEIVLNDLIHFKRLNYSILSLCPEKKSVAIINILLIHVIYKYKFDGVQTKYQ